jgi:CBS domain-containing protein
MIVKARERLVTIGLDTPVREAAVLMSKPHVELVVVCDAQGRIAGVLAKTDIVGQISRCTGFSCTTGVSAIMTREVVSCRDRDWLGDAWTLMKQRSLPRLPVLDEEGRPIGILYARDALQGMLAETEDEEALLRDYVMGIGYR